MKLQNLIKNAKNIAGSIEKAQSTIKGIKGVADSIGVSGLVAKPNKAKPEKTAPAPKSSAAPVQAPAAELKEEIPAGGKPIEIDSLDGMTNWLTSLQADASQSVQSALRAQLQVIQFVQSPTLVDTTIDTLVLNLKQSLEDEQNPETRKNIHERFSLMIQNYVFFLDARLQLEINNNKQEAMRLFDMAGDMLSHSVVDVALLAMPGGALAKGSKFVVKNVFAGDNAANGNFFVSLIKYLWSRNDKEQKVADFYKIIYGIITKLDKYSDLIGKSMLISNMIERYIPNIVDYEFSTEESTKDGTNKHKLLRDDGKANLLQDDIDEMKSELKEMDMQLVEMGDPLWPWKRKAKKELEGKIENAKSLLKDKQKELKHIKIFARTKFEQSLHSIAEKFNEL